MYDQMCSADGESNKVSFVQFWRVFRKDFPLLKFRQHSTSSTCSVCTRHKLLIREMSHHLAARRKQHELYIHHLQHQYQDRCLYWQLRSLSRSRCGEICTILDSMDQAKFCYPREGVYRTKELASLQRPRAHITGILMHGHGVMFSVSAQDMLKDSNSMIELMSHALTTLQKEHNIQLLNRSNKQQKHVSNSLQRVEKRSLIQGRTFWNKYPTKTKMTMEHPPFEDVFLLKIVIFQVVMLVFTGATLKTTVHISIRFSQLSPLPLKTSPVVCYFKTW